MRRSLTTLRFVHRARQVVVGKGGFRVDAFLQNAIFHQEIAESLPDIQRLLAPARRVGLVLRGEPFSAGPDQIGDRSPARP